MNIICRFTILPLTSILCAGLKVCNVRSISCNEFKYTDYVSKMNSFTDSTIVLTNTDGPNNQRLTHRCNKCGNKYTWSSSLRRHQMQCGNKEATICCHFCTKKFFRRDRLKQHLFSYHAQLMVSKRK
ncbi:Longitudinals lacking protein, isoform G [Cyphomyrmex costatus]|uniref:Longitudinals lacking protein, isoform G n=1 Tax=Cyphomyrmex costatus TaxID=456900 RepID=A0A195CRY3_9HYME|nr:Longitudinals lacking protein, isoform G [Cyphomyrmex costatus]